MSRKHKIFWKIIRPCIAWPLAKLKFGYTYDVPKNLPENYLVLSNHVTDFDPILVGLSFPRQMFFVGSEHISRWKFFYKLIRFIFAPIMRYKGSVASQTVLEVLRKTRSGENVCIFAEGTRSWDGLTNPILPSTGKMAKKAGCALVTYKLTGGYFVSPNWAEGGTRRGPFHGGVVNIYTKEQLANLSAQEVNEAICRDLYEDAYARQKADPKPYKGKQLAVKMENLLYFCPLCGKLETLSSQKDRVSCSACGGSFTYDQFGMLHGLDYDTLTEAARWQRQKMAERVAQNVPITAPDVTVRTVENHVETELPGGEVTMDRQAIAWGETRIDLESISEMAMHGRHALVFTAGKVYYELLIPSGSNTLKFLHFYEECKNVNKIPAEKSVI